MKRIRFFTLLFALVTTAVTGWAQTDYSTVLTSNVGLSNTGTNDYGTAVKVQFELGKTVPQYDAFLAEQMQIGTANRYAGAVTITAPAGTKKLHFHAVTRTDGTSQLQVGVPNGSGSLLSTTLVKDEGFTGSTPIILTTSPANCFFTVTFNTALTEDTQVAFLSTKTSGNGDPFLLYGVNAETVLTVAQALQQSTGNQIYVRGIVAKKNEMSDGSITYWISDDGTETNMLQISNGKNLNGTDFTSDSQLRVRDEVVVYGQVFGKVGAVKVLNQSYLISVEHPKYYWMDTDEELTYDESLNAYVITKEFTVSGSELWHEFWIEDENRNYLGNPGSSDNYYHIYLMTHKNIPVTNEGERRKFRIGEGTFTFILNVEDMTLSVTGWPPTYEISVGNQLVEEMLNLNEQLQKNDDGTYSRTVTITQLFLDNNGSLAFAIFDLNELIYYGGGDDLIIITEDNCTDIPLTFGSSVSRIILGQTGTYNIIFNPTDLTVSVVKQAVGGQKFYYSGGSGGYGPGNMPQLTYNPSTNAYEAEVEITAGQNWIIITGNKANDWGEWGNLQYYGISEGNAYNRDYIVTAGDNELQIQETASADFLFLVPGTYKISLTPDLKFSVTWPEGISDKYYFRKGSSIEEMSQPSSDGSYYYTVNLTPSDVQNTSDYPVFEIVSGDGHTYGPQGENWVITETNCQNLPVVKDTRMKWFKVSEPGEYTFIFNPTAMTLSVTMPTTEYKYYFLKVKSDWSGTDQVGELVYNADTNTYESTENLVVEENPGFANFYISTKDNPDMWSDLYGSSESVNLAEVNSIQLTASGIPLLISSVGTYKLSLDATTMTLTVTAVSSIEPTDISQMDNVIYMEPQEVRTGAQATLTLKMKNNVPIRGFQFDLYLPEGLTAATSSNGKILATLDNTRLPEGDDHQLTTSIQSDGAVRFLCNSQYDENFATGDDIVLTLKVDVSENMQEGEYPIELKTVKLSETDITKYYLTGLIRSKVTVSSFLLGDVNADGFVDISDYISVANYIHGSIADGFVLKAGDIDSSGTIDITDYIGISNIIHTGTPSGTSAAGAKAAVFDLEEVSELDPE